VSQFTPLSWHDALRDWSRQLDTCAEKLRAQVPPGHVDYISKGSAAAWLGTLSREMVQLVDAAAREGGEA
jgi:hypothetical protein